MAAPQAVGGIRSFAEPAADEYRQTVRAWLRRAVPADWRTDEPTTFDAAIQRRRAWDQLVGRAGWGGITWPREYGGRGEGPIEEYIFYDEAAAFGVPDTANSAALDLAGPVIYQFGTEDQKARHLGPILRGEEFWCEGLSEPDAGSDLAAASTSATRDDAGDWRINGQKVWTSRAQFADRCFLLARTGDGRRHHNLSIFLISMRQPGVEVRPIRQITSDPEFNEVFYDDARVAEADRVGELNEAWSIVGLSGFRQRRRVFDGLRWLVAIRGTLVQLRQCVDECGAGYLNATVTELGSDVETFAWHLRRVAELIAIDGAWQGPNSITRPVWPELWQRIATAGVDVGCAEHEHYWRQKFLETRAATIHGGTSQIQRNVIAERVLGLPR